MTITSTLLSSRPSIPADLGGELRPLPRPHEPPLRVQLSAAPCAPHVSTGRPDGAPTHRNAGGDPQRRARTFAFPYLRDTLREIGDRWQVGKQSRPHRRTEKGDAATEPRGRVTTSVETLPVRIPQKKGNSGSDVKGGDGPEKHSVSLAPQQPDHCPPPSLER
eukprot:1193122-Prorocentrum_minimum.AAC.4